MMNGVELGLVVAFAAAISAGIIVIMLPLLRRYALAHPNARSSHSKSTPQGGGIAVIAATLAVAGSAAAIGLNEPDFDPISLWLVFGSHSLYRHGRHGRRYPDHRGGAAAAAAGARGRHRDREPSRRASCSAGAAVVDRARAAADRLPLVRQPDELHGRHRLDDGRRIRAGRGRARADPDGSARCRCTASSWRWRCAAR